MINNYYDMNYKRFFSISRSSFFSVRVINDWNSLPQSVIDANSPNQFKNLLDRHYIDVMYDL